MSARRALALGCAAALGTGYWTSMSSQSQLWGPFPASADGAREVALTFDDGPNEPYTTALLDLLERRGVRATFFQVGRAVQRFPDVTAAVAAAGHVVGNHSHRHELHRCFTARLVDEEIRRAQDEIGHVLGRRPALYRPPWLARSPATFAALRRHGLHPVSGTFCHPLEVARIPARRTAARAVARARSGAMIIFHDGYNGRGADRTRTLDAVARTVDTLAERGTTFVTVDALLGVPAYLDRVRTAGR